MTRITTAKTIALSLAAFVTITLFGAVDELAYEQHAAVQLAHSMAAGSTTAMAKVPQAKRS